MGEGTAQVVCHYPHDRVLELIELAERPDQPGIPDRDGGLCRKQPELLRVALGEGPGTLSSYGEHAEELLPPRHRHPNRASRHRLRLAARFATSSGCIPDDCRPVSQNLPRKTLTAMYPMHLALTVGLPEPERGKRPAFDDPVLVRVHCECLTGDIMGSLRCDCGPQLHQALRMVQEEGRGVVLYMRQEGRGIGLANKLRAYSLQERHGLDTVEANERLGFQPDQREYGIGAQILYDLGIRRLRLLTNNMGKYVALTGYGIEIVERVPLELPPGEDNREYLRTKKLKMGHLLKSV